jgi:hypothetical protein
MTTHHTPEDFARANVRIEALIKIDKQIVLLRKRENTCWEMCEIFLRARDAHGLHDMGVEIQGLQWALRELEKAR